MSKDCQHTMLFLGSHPDFRKGWLCWDCHKQIDGFDLRLYGDEYAVVMAAIRIKPPNEVRDAR